MKPFFKKINLTLISCSILSISTWAISGQMYVYQNKNGETLLTNRKSSDKSLTRIKATYYPESNIHSYKNWGRTEASVPTGFSKQQNTYDHLIHQAAQTHGVSAGLIKAVIHTESGFNLHARSPVGAQGLMQLMPATAKRFNVSNVFDAQQNILGGARYLSWLLKRFNGDTTLALAAYNAGEGNVTKYGGIPPFKETQDYVRRVTSRFNNLYSQGVNIQASNAATMQNNAAPQAPNNVGISSPSNQHQRAIIIAEDGRYTDTPIKSYSTTHATASAKIFIEN